MNRFQQALLPYKKNYILRAVVIISFSFGVWISISGGIEEGVGLLFLVLYLEYITINLIFEMDFAPTNVFARRAFGSKESFGYRATYYFVYISFWLMAIIAIVDKAT